MIKSSGDKPVRAQSKKEIQKKLVIMLPHKNCFTHFPGRRLPVLTFCSWYHSRNSEGLGASRTWQVRRSVDPLSKYSSRPAVITARGSARRKGGGDEAGKIRGAEQGVQGIVEASHALPRAENSSEIAHRKPKLRGEHQEDFSLTCVSAQK